MQSGDYVTARYFNNVIMDFLKIVKSLILFIAQVISPKKSIKLLKYAIKNIHLSNRCVSL
jgi:hypothetical protein